MVYFTCGTCGEQIKKPQVEKHYTQKCRNCTMLTCIDCLKDFYGDEYKKHNQCMTEAQRYSKEGREGWDPSVGQGNKGEMKQQAWIGRLRGLLETEEDVDYAVKNIIDTILDHDNVPRKRPKFINFVKNIMRNKAHITSIEATWELFSKALTPPAEPTPPKKEEPMEVPPAAEPEPAVKEKKKKKKKDKEDAIEAAQAQAPAPEQMEVEERKTKKQKKKDKNKENLAAPASDPEPPVKEKGKKRKLEETDDSVLEPAEKKGKFDWDEIITSILTKKEEMKLVKLKKKCIAEFMAQFPDTHKSQEKLGSKFDKMLKKRKYKVLKDKVMLAHPEDEETAEETPAENGHQEQNGSSKAVIGAAHATNGVPATNGVHSTEQQQTNGEKLSWNKWEATNLGSDSQTEKFRRLMGIKTTNPPQAIAAAKRNDGKIFRDLESGFERARNTHFKAKGMGLGFS